MHAQAVVARHGITAPMVGHVGDGNYHMMLLVNPDSDGERPPHACTKPASQLTGCNFCAAVPNLALHSQNPQIMLDSALWADGTLQRVCRRAGGCRGGEGG